MTRFILHTPHLADLVNALMTAETLANFGLVIRRMREDMGLAESHLGEMVKMLPHEIAAIERGEKVPDIQTAARLLMALYRAGKGDAL